MDIIAAISPTNEIRPLVDELDQELGALYAPEQRHGLALYAIFEPHIRFIVVHKNNRAVRCGGLALLADFAEVKGMYVRPAVRGQGVADTVMARLIAETRGAGLCLLSLETCTASFAAINFYRSSGSRDCPVFEPYASLPPHRIAAGAFLERQVS